MNRFKNKKDLKKIILKLKFKLDSSDEHSSNDVSSSMRRSKNGGDQDKELDGLLSSKVSH